MLDKLRYIPAVLAAGVFFILLGLVYLSDGKEGALQLLSRMDIEI